MFALDPRLERDTLPVGDLPLSRLLLMNDAQYPWLILVPRRPGVSELFDLTPEEQRQLCEETTRVAETLKALCGAEKMNVATLGNVVGQLHMHVIARHGGDPAWPGPVWGRLPAQPYEAGAASVWRERLRQAFAERPGFLEE